jgi:hypothetical protein
LNVAGWHVESWPTLDHSNRPVSVLRQYFSAPNAKVRTGSVDAINLDEDEEKRPNQGKQSGVHRSFNSGIESAPPLAASVRQAEQDDDEGGRQGEADASAKCGLANKRRPGGWTIEAMWQRDAASDSPSSGSAEPFFLSTSTSLLWKDLAQASRL